MNAYATILTTVLIIVFLTGVLRVFQYILEPSSIWLANMLLQSVVSPLILLSLPQSKSYQF